MHPALLALASTMTWTDPQRVELDLTRRDSWHVAPAGTAGVILLGSDREGRAWTFTRLDTQFRPVWTREWTAPSGAELERVEAHDGAVWMLLYQREEQTLGLTRVAVADGATRLVSAFAPAKAPHLVDLRIQGDDAWVLTADAQPVAAAEGQLLHVDLRQGKAAEVDVGAALGALDRPLFQPFGSNPTGTDLVAVTRRNGHNRLDVFGLGRELGEPLTVSGDDAHNLVVLQRKAMADGSDLVIGSYDDDVRGSWAQGLYFSKIKDGAPVFSQWHPFQDFTHFFDALPTRQRELMRAAVTRRHAKQRDFPFPWMVQVDAVVDQGDRYVMVGEAWSPQYETRIRTRYEVVGGHAQPKTGPVKVFVGWLLTHAVVAAFDQEGELVWDRSINLGEVLSTDLRPRMQVREHDGELELNWSRGGELHWATVHPDGEFTTMDEHEPEEAERAVKLALDTEADTALWYGDTFLSWGYHTSLDGDRRVFALSRVEP